MSTQGAEANASGEFIKRMIEGEFTRFKIPIFNYRANANNGDLLSSRYGLRGVPYICCFDYETNNGLVYREFTETADIRIVPYCQDTSGSADWKLHAIFFNGRDFMPENEIWFVISGDGIRPPILAWFKRQAAQSETKTIRVLTVAEYRQAFKALVSPSKPPRPEARHYSQ